MKGLFKRCLLCMNWFWRAHVLRKCHVCWEWRKAVKEKLCESPYMEMILACFMQIANLWHTEAHLEYYKFITIKFKSKFMSIRLNCFVRASPVCTNMLALGQRQQGVVKVPKNNIDQWFKKKKEKSCFMLTNPPKPPFHSFTQVVMTEIALITNAYDKVLISVVHR